MKFIRLTFAFLCLFAASAFAQTYGTIALTTFPAVMPASGTTNVNAVLDVRQNRNVGITIKAKGVSNASTLAVTFLRSADGVIYETLDLTPYVFTLTTATNAVYTLTTNIDMTSFGYLKLSTVVAGSGTGGYTNLAVTAALKPGN